MKGREVKCRGLGISVVDYLVLRLQVVHVAHCNGVLDGDRTGGNVCSVYIYLHI